MKPGATVLDDDVREHQLFLEWLLWQRLFVIKTFAAVHTDAMLETCSMWKTCFKTCLAPSD